MDFEWDEAKRRGNVNRHKIDFVDVLPLFINPNAISFADTRIDYGEERFILLCVKDDMLLQIVYTLRSTTIRIISARRCNKRERRRYDQAQKNRKNH